MNKSIYTYKSHTKATALALWVLLLLSTSVTLSLIVHNFLEKYGFLLLGLLIIPIAVAFLSVWRITVIANFLTAEILIRREKIIFGSYETNHKAIEVSKVLWSCDGSAGVVKITLHDSTEFYLHDEYSSVLADEARRLAEEFARAFNFPIEKITRDDVLIGILDK